MFSGSNIVSMCVIVFREKLFALCRSLKIGLKIRLRSKIGSKIELRSDCGGTFLELAIGLPIFLAVIFFIIYISVLENIEHSTATAVGNATRLAYTRGDLVIDNLNFIESVEQWRTAGCSSPNSHPGFQFFFTLF